MRESELYQFLRRKLPAFDLDRIENALSSGIFDSTVTAKDVMLWVELKIQRQANVIEEVRPSQLAWAYLKLKSRAICGNRLALISCKTLSVIDLWSFHLSEEPGVSRNGIKLNHVGAFAGSACSPLLTSAIANFSDDYPFGVT